MITPNFEKLNGLVPVIAQDHESGEVLMLAFMNQQAWEATLNTGKATYWSRTRQELWIKGQTSGNHQGYWTESNPSSRIVRNRRERSNGKSRMIRRSGNR